MVVDNFYTEIDDGCELCPLDHCCNNSDLQNQADPESLIVERTVPGTFVTLAILTSQRKSSQKLIILLKIFLKYILMSTVDKHARSIYDFRLSGFPDTLLFRPVYFP